MTMTATAAGLAKQLGSSVFVGAVVAVGVFAAEVQGCMAANVFCDI